jgi:dihydroorotate dehydrogenase electron transfer subunit
VRQEIATVISNRKIMPEFPKTYGRSILGSYVVRLRCTETAKESKPGHFIMLRCGEECTLPRPFSIHKVQNKDELAILYAVLKGGKGTKWLSERKTGDTIDTFGPLGNGYTIYPESKKLLLVAGGIGIAPLNFLAKQALSQGRSITLLYGTANRYQYPKAYLPKGIELHSATEDGTKGKKGMVTDLLPDFAKWADQIFACGPVGMYKAMAQMPELKDKPVQLSLEIMMGCGVGVCYGCTIKTRSGLKQVCQDGPVFDLEDIIWEEISTI